jgi:predicted nucleotidyltransferase
MLQIQYIMKWDLGDLVFDYYPRNMWVSHVQAFTYCGLLPNQSASHLSTIKDKDPHTVYTISPKNYTSFGQTYIAHYLNRDAFRPVTDVYGTKLSVVARHNHPTWAEYTTTNQWYLNQLKAAKIIKLLYLLPGVKEVYITGSTALELAHKQSDIDLIIKTHPGQVWLSRFWAKLILKILRLDVHDVILESQIWVWRILYFVRLISISLYSNRIREIENSIWIKKTRGGLIDIGLLYEDLDDVVSVFPKETRNLSIWSSLLVPRTCGSLNQTSEFAGYAQYWLRVGKIEWVKQLIIKHSLAIVSFILSPLLSLQYYFYTYRSADYVYFVIKKTMICYFPISYKPKSLLEYQIRSKS